MRMIDIINKKRLGEVLTRDEINFWIEGLSNDTIPTYQSSALAMAITINGMSKEETYYLTGAMASSGDILDLSKMKGVFIDKHSTGGVGDKTSIVLAPMVAACGGYVAKMSGRGLGHTGGTLDKLESIPGYNVSLSQDQFIKQVNKHHIAIIGQSASLAPADKKLYALRDVTGTVQSIPLIASSIMSKKIAGGAHGIVLDVTVGNGAFMTKAKDASELAKVMINIGRHYHRDTRAVISNMNQPLGYAIGNGLEVIEAVEALMGKGPEDLMELCYTLGSLMLIQSGTYKNVKSARKALEKAVTSGDALAKLAELVKAQGGDESYIYTPTKIKLSRRHIDVLSTQSGYIKAIDTLQLGLASMELGAGRNKIEDSIDHGAGILLHKKIGDYVEVDEKIATLYTSKKEIDYIPIKVLNSFSLSPKPVKNPELILEIL